MDPTPKSVSDVCAIRLTSIENGVATKGVVVDSAEVATPQTKHCVEVPPMPRVRRREREAIGSTRR